MTDQTMGMAALLPVVLDAAARGMVVLAAAGLLSLVLRRASAATRHLVWAVAVAAVLVLPAFRAIVPDLPVLPAASAEALWFSTAGSPRAVVAADPAAVSAPTRDANASAAAVSEEVASAARAGNVRGDGGATRSARADARAGVPGAAASGDAIRGTSAPASRNAGAGDAAGWLVLLWAGIGGALLVPVAAGWRALRRLERDSEEVGSARVRHLATRLALRIGLNREFRVVTGPSRAMPMTWGIRRPVILLPSEAVDWPASRLEAVLLHELAHVKRHDCLTQLLAELTRAVHWFNPLVWVAARRLRVERERACDDVALAGGARASGYATELLGLARAYRASRATTLAAVAMARPSQLSDRLLAVLDESRRRDSIGRRMALRVLGLAILIVLPLSALAPMAAASTDDGTAAADAAAIPMGGLDGMVPADAWVSPEEAASPVPNARRTHEGAASTASKAGVIVPHAMIARPIGAQDPTCAAGPGDWEQIQHQSNDDRSTIRMRRPGCELEVRIEGEVRFDADAVTVARMADDARIRIEEDDGRTERYLDVRPGARGVPSYDYRVNRREAAFDGGAQAWYRAVLLHLFRSAGFAAEERVAALLRRGGVEAVLAELGRIESSFVFARYTQELLEQEQLGEAALRALVRSSGRRVESDHYMAEILQAVARHQPLRGGTLDEYIGAAMTLDSDHYRTEALRTVVRAGGLNNQQVAGVLEAASGMDSDHYKSELLTEVADRYALEPAFRAAYLAATAELDSDHYRSEVLERLLRRDDLSPAELADVIAAAAMLDSDHYRSEILRSAAARGLGSASLHRAFFEAAAGLDSDHYYRETMNLLVDQEDVEPELLVTVLSHAEAELGSDHALSELLLRVVDRHPVTGAVREAFLRAMESLDSDHYRGRVADALLRSGTA